MREAQGPRVSGVSGRETRGGAGAGALIPSGVGAGEVVGRQRAPVPTRSGEQEGDAGVSWAGPGSGRGWRPSLGRGSVQTGHGSSGGERAFPFSVLFCFLFSFYLLIPFSVLFHLKHLGIL